MIDKTFPLAEKLTSNGLSLVKQLEQLLNQESACLTKGGQQIEQLNTITTQKQPLNAQINQFSRQMTQILAAESLPNNQQGMLQYLENAKLMGLMTEQLSHNWTETTQTAARCRERNEENGASIDILRKHTLRSLQILKGPSQNTVTYGKDGSTQSSKYSRTLISV